MTIGADYESQKVHIGNEVINVHIWDTGNCITCSLAHIGVIKCMCVCVNSSMFHILFAVKFYNYYKQLIIEHIKFQTLGYRKIRKLLT